MGRLDGYGLLACHAQPLDPQGASPGAPAKAPCKVPAGAHLAGVQQNRARDKRLTAPTTMAATVALAAAMGGLGSATASAWPANGHALQVRLTTGEITPNTSNEVNAAFEKEYPGWKVNPEIQQWSGIAAKLITAGPRSPHRPAGGDIVPENGSVPALVVPLFLILDKARLLGAFKGLILTYVALTFPFTIWALRCFVRSVPVDLEQAAMVDGSSRLGASRQSLFPLVLPGIITTGVFMFITAWNDFVYADVIMQ